MYIKGILLIFRSYFEDILLNLENIFWGNFLDKLVLVDKLIENLIR